MTFKTWEKVYWAIMGFLFAFSCLPIFGLGKVTYNGKVIKVGEDISRSAYFGYLLLGLIVPAILWIIIRLIVNGGWEDKEKKKN